MYYNGQIVFDHATSKPCKVGNPHDGSQWAWENIPKDSTHFIKDGKLHLPKSIEEAEKDLTEGTITPARL